jgi:hypothetical protein
VALHLVRTVRAFSVSYGDVERFAGACRDAFWERRWLAPVQKSKLVGSGHAHSIPDHSGAVVHEQPIHVSSQEQLLTSVRGDCDDAAAGSNESYRTAAAELAI